MFSVSNNLESFLNWLNLVMKQKNITQADIARTNHVRPSSVSMLFSMQVKSVGIDMCRAIAAATGVPLETVYRRAGLLPDIPLSQEEIDEIVAITSQLDDDLRQNALDYILHLADKQRIRRKTQLAPQNVA
jgi:transcriptional regulator with XRE-family HTH domain